MHKFKSLFLFVAIALTYTCGGYAASANKSSHEVEEELQMNEALAKKLPIPMGSMGQITEATVSGKFIRFVFEVSNQYADAYSSLSEEKLKKTLLMQLGAMGFSPFEDYGITYVFRFNNDSSKDKVVNLSADELKNQLQVSSSPGVATNDALQILKMRADKLNESAPAKLDDYTVFTGCSLNDTAFVYSYTIVESDVVLLDNMVADFQQNLYQLNKESLRQQGLSVSSFLSQLAMVNRVLLFHYKGSKSGRLVDVVFHKSELEDLVRQIKADYEKSLKNK